MHKPRVAVLTGIYPPDSGGPATFAVSFSNFLQNSGYTTLVLSFTDGVSSAEGSTGQSVQLISRKFGHFKRTTLVVFNLIRIFYGKFHVIANGMFIETYLASLITRGNYLVKIPGDIVWERATNSRITSLNVQEFQNSKLSWKYKIFRFLFTKSILRAHTVVVPSPALFELCLLWGVSRDKLRMVFNSVDTEFFVPARSPKKRFDCIVVNRLVGLKNVDQVIFACHALGKSLLVVGDGPEYKELKRLAEQLGADVSFAGNVSRLELLNHLQSASIYILNSTVDATAYSLLEARSCGLISIGNVNSGASEIIEHGVDGYLSDDVGYLELQRIIGVISSMSASEILEVSRRARDSTISFFDTKHNFSQILNLILGVKC